MWNSTECYVQSRNPLPGRLLAADIGVLSATTAFGKTVIGAYLIAQRKVNTLVLVQSSALLEQWKSSLEQFLNIHEVLPELPKKRGRKKKRHLIGQIGSGKNTRSGIVDIATMQSLLEGEEKTVKSFVAEYGMVIVDECHHVAAFTFETVLKPWKPNMFTVCLPHLSARTAIIPSSLCSAVLSGIWWTQKARREAKLLSYRNPQIYSHEVCRMPTGFRICTPV